MTWIASDASGGCWTAVDIIARCAASAQECPITITAQFVTESDSTFDRTYRDFISFGTPLPARKAPTRSRSTHQEDSAAGLTA